VSEHRECAKQHWDRIWEQWADASRRRPGGCDWLVPFEPLWADKPSLRVLDLGCGSGRDALCLMGLGLQIVAADRSWEALSSLRVVEPSLPSVCLDLGEGLPLVDRCLDGILASLSLHYFDCAQTLRVVSDLGRCLRPNGWLLARLNASDDVAHGAEGNPEIDHGGYLVGGRIKRFFARGDIERLFAPPWRIEYCAHVTVERYGSPKPLWQLIVRWEPHR